MSDPVIRAEGLVKSYSGRRVLDGISFEVSRGEIFALLGPNGAGKTTTMEILEGYRRPDEGSASVLSAPPGSRAAKAQIGVMLQEGGLYPGLEVQEAMRLFASYYPDPKPWEDVLEVVDLQNKKDARVRNLSGGEKQRLSFALSLIGNPRLVFLDEPTSGMDPIARARAWSHIEDLNADGVTVILSTNALAEAEELASRLAIIDKGKVVALGLIEDLLEKGRRIEFVTDREIETLSWNEVRIESHSQNRYSMTIIADSKTIAGLTSWLNESGITIVELRTGGGLSELFSSLVEGGSS